MVVIAAMDRSGAIGRGNALPWHLPKDLQRFKSLTLGKPILMGRKTAEAIGRALPGRENFVLTRGTRAPFTGQRPVATLDEARMLAGEDSLVVIGGSEVYALALPLAERLHLTMIDTDVTGADAFFPLFNPLEWRQLKREKHRADARHPFDFAYLDLERRR